MSSGCRRPRLMAKVAAALIGIALMAAPASARELRVCADPNNLPFSDAQERGFENRIAKIVAREMGAEVSYVWRAQRRAFVRETLSAGVCDLILGLPAGFERARTTPPYYRSAYAFVTRPGEPAVSSFDDPGLRERTVGVQLIGDDGWNTPPAHALSERGIIANVRGYTVQGDYGREAPAARIVEAVASHEIDVAVVWGPLAGWAAARETPPLVVTPFEGAKDRTGLPMAFAIAMGVRHGDEALADEVTRALFHRRDDILAALAQWHVPLVTP